MSKWAAISHTLPEYHGKSTVQFGKECLSDSHAVESEAAAGWVVLIYCNQRPMWLWLQVIIIARSLKPIALEVLFKDTSKYITSWHLANANIDIRLFDPSYGIDGCTFNRTGSNPSAIHEWCKLCGLRWILDPQSAELRQKFVTGRRLSGLRVSYWCLHFPKAEGDWKAAKHMRYQHLVKVTGRVTLTLILWSSVTTRVSNFQDNPIAGSSQCRLSMAMTVMIRPKFC